MCRNIRPLANFEPPVTGEEIDAAALQYVRKISGTTRPARVNEEAFDRAGNDLSSTRAARRGSTGTVTGDRHRAEGARRAGRDPRRTDRPRAHRTAQRVAGGAPGGAVPVRLPAGGALPAADLADDGLPAQ